MATAGKPSSIHLRIGDVILLYCCVADEERNVEKSYEKSSSIGGKKSGYILADFSGCFQHQILTVLTDDDDQPKNIEVGAFLVHSANKYIAFKQYKELDGQLNELDKRLHVNTAALDLLKLQVEQAKRDSQVERVENYFRQGRLQGTTVKYGDTVQLKHILSGKYVDVISTETSVTESSKLLVHLAENDNAGCVFRLHPHTQVEILGNKVNYDDQMKLESVANEFQFLHCSERSCNDANVKVFSKDRCELNAAAKGSVFKMEYFSHQELSNEPTTNFVQSNAVVSIFHSPHQAYLSAEGSFEYNYIIMPSSAGVEETAPTSVPEPPVSEPDVLRPEPSSSDQKHELPVQVEVHVEFEDSEDPPRKDIEETDTPLLSTEPQLGDHGLTKALRADSVQYGSFNYDSTVTENVHFNMTTKAGIKTTSSPNHFWKIVKNDFRHCGEPLLWDEECRIMHLPTRRYLSVVGSAPNFELTLKTYAENEDDSTIFKLFPAVQQSTEKVVYQAYMRIQHRDSGTWLHLNREREFKSNGFHPFRTYEADCETQAETDLFQVGLTSEINSDDVYTLGQIELPLAAEFNKIADITSVLANQSRKCSSFDGAFHTHHDCGLSYTLSSLKHLKYLLSSENKMVKVQPKIIRSLKTLELATSLLYMHTEDGNFDQELCAAYFDIIIEFLKGKGSKNKIYVSPMIHHIFTYKIREIDMPEDQIVEKALEAVVNDNPTLLYKFDFIEGVVPHLTRQLVSCRMDQTRAIHLLEVLAALCSCNRAPVKNNQDIILKSLKAMFAAKTSILCPLRAATGREAKFKETIVSFEDEETTDSRSNGPAEEIQIDCHHLLQTGDGGGDSWWSLWTVPESIQSFLYAELKLLWRLCQGNNSTAIQVLKGEHQTVSVGVQLNFDIIMAALNDKNLKKYDKRKRYPPRIRALMVKLLQAMYVDVDVCRPFLERIPFAFKIQDADQSLMTLLEAKSVDMSDLSHISKIKEWVDIFFQDENKFLCNVPEDEYNKMVVRVLQLFSELVKHGYYSDPKDVSHWIDLLMDLLWRQTDTLTEQGASTSQQLQQLPDVIKEQWMRGRGSRKSTSLVRGFIRRSGRERHVISHEKRNLLKVKEWALVVLNLLFNFQLFKGIKMFMHDYCYLSSIDEEDTDTGMDNDILLHKVTEPKGLDKELKILIHESPIKVEKPKHSEKRIIQMAKDRLYTISHKEADPDVNFDRQLPDVLLDLAAHMDDGLVLKSLLLLNRHISFESEILSTALKIQLVETEESVRVYNSVVKLQVQMKDYLNGRLVFESTASPVQVLTGYCYLEDEVGEPHQINQRIIISFGIVSDVLKYVLDECKIIQRSEEDNIKLMECFNLLLGLTQNNHEVQLKLLSHVNTFLYAANEIGASVGLLLREIFHGGPSISLVLRPEMAKKILRLVLAKTKNQQVTKSSLQVETISSLADALQELVVVRELDIPLKHYQLILTRTFTFMREDENYWCHDLLLESKKSYREQLLISENGANSDLANLLIITDLLGSCAFGGLSGTGSLCRTVYSKQELIRIISCQDIEVYRRRPFVQFFVWVYLTGDESMESENMLVYKMKRELSIFLKEVDEILKKLCSILQNISRSSYINVKTFMKRPSMKYCSEALSRKDTDVLTADLLLYLSDGVFPFLQVMYKNQDLPIEKSESVEIYKSLLRLHPIFKESDRLFFLSEIIRNYYRSLMAVRTYIQRNSSLKIDNDMELSAIELDILMDSELLEREHVSSTRMKYKEIYHSEIKLNDKFREYVLNYKATYEGRNTNESQVVYRTPNAYTPSQEEYSEFIDEERNIQGPRCLPLGKYFQDHVQAFRYKESSRNPNLALARHLVIAGQPKLRSVHLTTIAAEALTELDIKSLQILRATIYNEFVQIDPEEKERSPETYYRKCKDRLNPLQTEILGLDFSKIILLLSQGNECIATEVLALTDVMLESTSHNLQEKICDIIAKDENKVIPTILSILKRVASMYKESEFMCFILMKRKNDDARLLPHNSKQVIASSRRISTPTTGHRRNRRRSSGGYTLTRSSTLELLKTESGKRVPFMALNQDSYISSSFMPPEFRHLLFYEISRVSLICKILGLLCTGQYTKMQHFLRDQDGSIHSINVVGELTSFLLQIIGGKNYTIDMVELYIQILRSLTEMCVGNVKNCEALFEKNMVSLLSSILQINITDVGNTAASVSAETFNDDAHQVLRKNALLLKVASIELLEVMVKKTSSRSQSLVNRVYRGLDKQAIYWCMADFYTLRKDTKFIEMKVDDNAERALFSAYNICMYFVDSGVAKIGELEPEDEKLREIWNSCAVRSRSVEVLYRSQDSNEELLTKVHFNLATKNDITDKIKENTWYHIDRSTHGDKIRDFQKWTRAIIKVTQHQDRVQQSKLGVVTKLSLLRYNVLMVLTVILNLIVLATYRIPDIISPTNNTISTDPEITPTITTDPEITPKIPTFPELPTVIEVTLLVVGCIHLFFSLWMVIDYFVVSGPFLVLPKWLYDLELIPSSFKKFQFFKKLSEKRILPKVEYTYSSVNILGFPTLFPIIFLACSVLSLAFKGYFYSICLFYVIVDNDILKRALASVTRNIKSLLWVAVLVLIVIFVYSIITFAFFEASFNESDNGFCKSLHECFASVLRIGLVDNFLDISTANANVGIGRLFFDVSFFILVTTIGLNIVFGIIVDAFSELRDERFRAEQDMKAACFICNIPSYKFDKLQNMGFNLHVKHEHNMWNYVHYLMYLEQYGVNNKPIGKYVHDKIADKSTDYYPFNKALAFEGEEEGEEFRKELRQLEQTIIGRFSGLELQFKAVEESISKLEKND